MLKVVLDTQIILRGAGSPTPSITSRIYAAWDGGHFTLLLSEPILTEVENVLSRPEVLRKLRMTPIEAGALIELLRRRSTLITPGAAIALSCDPNDAMNPSSDGVSQTLSEALLFFIVDPPG